MKKLWTIEISREQRFTAYVEAENPASIEGILAHQFDPEHFGPNSGIEFGRPREVTTRPEEDQMIIYGPMDITPAEWWDRHEERLAERARTPGTPEYHAAVEAAGQQRLPEAG